TDDFGVCNLPRASVAPTGALRNVTSSSNLNGRLNQLQWLFATVLVAIPIAL
ncbi:unnamed protein product, partial [Ilex paraguariensis]